ncbi:MAG: hypothetical protein RUMPE_00819 [Eubacteriales bacterium SKADARSKE-1]|nr:hypothetical protein [Eubacteriales bacterium SKADARSKE-1]
MRKGFCVKKKLLNYFKKDTAFNQLTLNEASVIKEPSSLTIKFHIYIPRNMERIHRVVSLTPFILSVKEFVISGNKKLTIINCSVFLVYIDDYFMEKTYFYNFNTCISNETSPRILKGSQDKINDFTLVTGRYITANFTVKLKD